MEITQISEEQAIDMMHDAKKTIIETISFWKQKGYIKKRKLEEAREYHNKILECIGDKDFVLDWWTTLGKKYEEAILEIQETNK